MFSAYAPHGPPLHLGRHAVQKRASWVTSLIAEHEEEALSIHLHLMTWEAARRRWDASCCGPAQAAQVA